MSKLAFFIDPRTKAVVEGGAKLDRERLAAFWKELSIPEQIRYTATLARWRLRGHLSFGAANAAIVVSVDPVLVVSALSTDMDDVVLLRFDRQFVKAHDLKIGSQLLSVNVYRTLSEDAEPDSDIIFGPQNTLTFGNVHPVIADFLVRDRSVLADRIPAGHAEWARLEALTSSRTYTGLVGPRDGNPFRSWKSVLSNSSRRAIRDQFRNAADSLEVTQEAASRSFRRRRK